MAIVPQTKVGAIMWGKSHLVPFSNPVPLGLSATQVLEYADSLNSLDDAVIEAEEARMNAISKTESADAAHARFHRAAASCLSTIKAKAETVADPNTVYSQAQIPAARKRTPAGPPTDATHLSAQLQNNGAILLNWKGTVKQGQFFTVWRKLGSQPWTQIGSLAGKTFADTTLPPGTAYALYMVQAHRALRSSPGCEPIQIVFGSQGLMTAA